MSALLISNDATASKNYPISALKSPAPTKLVDRSVADECRKASAYAHS
jgi:hypothetical protein